jgi:hypothetical protein
VSSARRCGRGWWTSVPVPPIAVAALLVLAVAPIVLVLGSGDEPGAPERRSATETQEPPQRPEFPGFPDAQVVATGTAPVAGPWEIFTFTSRRLDDPPSPEVNPPAGLSCIGVRLLDPPPNHSGRISGGACGDFPGTPGFSRAQQTVPNLAGGAREILVFGWAPDEAAWVRVTFDGREPVEVQPVDGPEGGADYYLIAVPPDASGGRVNWVDKDGNEGSQGVEVLPP